MVNGRTSDGDAPGAQAHYGRWAIGAVLIAGVLGSALAWMLVLRQIEFERSEAFHAALAQNEDRSLVFQQYVSRVLGTADLACRHVAALRDLAAIRVGTRNHPSLIDDPIAQDRGFLGLSVVDARGDLVATTRKDWVGTPNVAQHPAFLAHRHQDTQRLFVSKPTYSHLLGDYAILLTRRLNGRNGAFAGVVTVHVAPAQLTAVFGQKAVKLSESAWLVGLDGTVRARVTAGVVKSGDDVTGGVLFRKQRRTGQGQLVGPGTLDGKVRLVSYRRVPDYPLFVSYSILRDEALLEAGQRANLLRIGAVLATFMVVVLSAIVIQFIRFRERRSREVAIAKSRLEEAQRVAGIGDWAYNVQEERVTWSPQLYGMYERFLPLSPFGAEFMEMLSEGSASRHKTEITRVLEEGVSAAWDIQVHLPSGESRFHRLSSVPTRSRSGAIVGFHGTIQDITEIKKRETLQNELAHLSRNGALNALAATLSHELNQPLTAASNYLSAAGYMASRLPDDAGASTSQAVQDARAQILRAGEIIKRVRGLASSAGERMVVSIDELLTEALATIAVTKVCAEPIVWDRAGEDILVNVDAVQIQQVILNLIRNACQAHNDGSPPPSVTVYSGSDSKVHLSVTDHGSGFSNEMLERIGTPIASSKNGGLGLGLSISKTIIEAHGGALQARNNAQRGATVSFSLPIHSRG